MERGNIASPINRPAIQSADQPISTLRLPNHARPAAELTKRRNIAMQSWG